MNVKITVIMNAILAKNIKAFRSQLGLTQEQLADYLKINREEISYYETAKRDIPKRFIPKLANLFGVSEYDLFEEDDAISNLNLAFAFRADVISTEDLEAIAQFKKIALNYLNIKKVLAENEL
jgi:transcriptional regulator, XRE family